MTPSEFEEFNVTELKEEFSPFVSWNRLLDYHGCRIVDAQSRRPDGSELRDVPADVDDVPKPECFSPAWETFCGRSKTSDDFRILGHKCLSVLKLDFVRPYIRDIQLEEKSILDRKVESSLQQTATENESWGKLYFLYN